MIGRCTSINITFLTIYIIGYPSAEVKRKIKKFSLVNTVEQRLYTLLERFIRLIRSGDIQNCRFVITQNTQFRNKNLDKIPRILYVCNYGYRDVSIEDKGVSASRENL